jgi:hypothetical protein
MIDLYISSKNKDMTPVKLITLLSNNNAECQITENYSSCKCDNNSTSIEYGFYIKIINIPITKFKQSVWETLKNNLNISCAFVECDDYKGCILNWPDIFRDSACSVLHN